MIRYLVDENKIRGKKIIIYGAGQVGREIFENLKAKEMVEVIAFIDKNIVLNQEFDVPIIRIDEIIDYECDYIIIGSVVPNVINDMIEFVNIFSGGKGKVIVPIPEVILDDGTKLIEPDTIEQFMKSVFEFNINTFLSEKEISELTIWFRYCIFKIENKEYYICLLKKLFYDNNVAIENRIVCGLLLFEQHSLNAEDNRELLCFLNQLGDEKLAYMWFLNREIAFFEQYQIKVVYNGEGYDRKKINKRVVDYYYKKDEVKVERESDKVVIIVPELIGQTESASIYYRFISNAIIDAGKKVKIIVASCSQVRAYGLFAIDNGFKLKQNQRCKELNRELLSQEVEIEYVEESIENIFNKVVRAVDAFTPFCVIDATDENIPISMALIDRYPVFYYPMRVCTSGYVFHRTRMRYFGYNDEVLDKNCELPMARISLNSEHTYSRKDRLKLDDDAFLVITVGNRFYSECDESLLLGMRNALNNKKKMHWIIVGVACNRNKGYFDESFDEVIDRLHFISYEDDLPALYRLCDVFLNPDRSGGGFSILFAMEQGIAVAALKKNGRLGAVWCGEQNLIDGDCLDLCKHIENLYDNPKVLENEKKKMKEQYLSFTPRKEWGKLLLCELEKTSNEYDLNNYGGDSLD